MLTTTMSSAGGTDTGRCGIAPTVNAETLQAVSSSGAWYTKSRLTVLDPIEWLRLQAQGVVARRTVPNLDQLWRTPADGYESRHRIVLNSGG